jgi:uncharacterized protein YtpQ (UPF0354 family)
MNNQTNQSDELKNLLEKIETLVPLVRGTLVSAPSQTESMDIPEDQKPYLEHYVGDLVILYAFDQLDHLVYLSKSQAQLLKAHIPNLLQVAVKNLSARAKNVNLFDLGNGLYGTTAGGNFESSLMLVDSLWEQISEQTPGGAMIAVPARDLLFIVGADSPNAKAIIKNRTNVDLPNPQYHVSNSVFVRTKTNGWTLALDS